MLIDPYAVAEVRVMFACRIDRRCNNQQFFCDIEVTSPDSLLPAGSSDLQPLVVGSVAEICDEVKDGGWCSEDSCAGSAEAAAAEFDERAGLLTPLLSRDCS
jgi:hypothetical protein